MIDIVGSFHGGYICTSTLVDHLSLTRTRAQALSITTVGAAVQWSVCHILTTTFHIKKRQTEHKLLAHIWMGLKIVAISACDMSLLYLVDCDDHSD